MKRLRISAISYLNTAPLMWDFEHGDAARAFDISYTLPSRCAGQLREGTADIGIIPAAAYASIPDLLVIPDVAIASRRAVRSILLVSKVPVEEITTVALDDSSMTSAALTKVLFARWWGGSHIYLNTRPVLDHMLLKHDAALLIGDPALQIDRSKYITYDLAEEWNRFTGKPFVFAFWAIRKASLKDLPQLDLPSIFQTSRDHGLLANNVAEIGRLWAPRLGLSEQQIREYLTESIHYYLDPPCIEGLKLFYQYARECRALPSIPSLHFMSAVNPAVV